MPLYKYINSGGGGGPTDPDALSALGFLRDKGTISLASEFPTPASVKFAHQYRVTATVTDSDVTKTNTGQTFNTGDEIYWTGAAWVLVDSPSAASGGTVISPPAVIASTASDNVDTHVPTAPTTYEWTVSIKDNVTGAFRSSKVLAQYDGSAVTHNVHENLVAGTSISRDINVNLNTGTVELEVINNGANPVTVVVGRYPIIEV